MTRISDIFFRTARAGLVCIALVLPAVSGAFPFGRSEAPGKTALRQGDAAASVGDRKNAEKFYTRALEQSKDDISLWSTAVFRLGTLALERNDIARAKALLQEFRMRLPAGSAGTLPGEIMAAENDFAGAEKFFNSLIERKDIHADKAQFCLGSLRLKQGRYDEALKIFSKLKNSRTELLARRAEYAQILALIKMDRVNEAVKLLEIPLKESSDINFKQLRLLCAVKAGDLDFFRKNHVAVANELYSDDFMSGVTELAAELASSKGDHQYAAKLYEDAFCFASGNDRKREIAAKLFSCCALFDAEKAAQVAERYARLFPNASDRALLQMQSGRLLASKGMYAKAVKFYSAVVHDRENLLVERRAAAREGAGAAEQGGLLKEADYFHNWLIKQAPDMIGKEESLLHYAGFLMRQNGSRSAVEILVRLTRSGSSAIREQAAYRLLQTKSKENLLSADDLQLAAMLEKSADSKIAEFGMFTSAEIFRISGRDETAVRKHYLDFAARYPASKFVPQARFHAARLAGKKGKYREAALEFVSFAEKFPEHKNSGAARYIAMDYFCRAEDAASAAEQLQKLKTQRKFPIAFASGILYLGEYMLNKNKCSDALKLISDMTSDKDTSHIADRSDILYLKARLHSKLKEYDSAMKELDKLIADHPDAPEAAEANFLAGNLRCDVYNTYAQAEKNFSAACKLVPSGVTGNAYAGRLADCRYTMYLKNKDEKLLIAAEEIYRKLADEAVLPAMRLHAWYKAGQCRETAGDRERALEDCEQLLYLALSLKEQGVMPEQRWCELAAYNAIQLALASDDFEGNVKAQQILAIYRRLGFADSEHDFDVLKHNIRERQKFLNRGAR